MSEECKRKLQLGDRVRSTVNATCEYIVIALCNAEGLAQVRSIVGTVDTDQDNQDAWRTLYQPVHVCPQDILEVVEV